MFDFIDEPIEAAKRESHFRSVAEEARITANKLPMVECG